MLRSALVFFYSKSCGQSNLEQNGLHSVCNEILCYWYNRGWGTWGLAIFKVYKPFDGIWWNDDIGQTCLLCFIIVIYITLIISHDWTISVIRDGLIIEHHLSSTKARQAIQDLSSIMMLGADITQIGPVTVSRTYPTTTPFWIISIIVCTVHCLHTLIQKNNVGSNLSRWKKIQIPQNWAS